MLLTSLCSEILDLNSFNSFQFFPLLFPIASSESQIQIKVTKPKIKKSFLSQLNSPSHFTKLSYTEPSKLCSFPGFPEKSPAKVRNQETINPRQLLQEVPRLLFDLPGYSLMVWLQPYPPLPDQRSTVLPSLLSTARG